MVLAECGCRPLCQKFSMTSYCCSCSLTTNIMHKAIDEAFSPCSQGSDGSAHLPRQLYLPPVKTLQLLDCLNGEFTTLLAVLACL